LPRHSSSHRDACWIPCRLIKPGNAGNSRNLSSDYLSPLRPHIGDSQAPCGWRSRNSRDRYSWPERRGLRDQMNDGVGRAATPSPIGIGVLERLWRGLNLPLAYRSSTPSRRARPHFRELHCGILWPGVVPPGTRDGPRQRSLRSIRRIRGHGERCQWVMRLP